MRAQFLDEFLRRAVAFDLETELIQPGLAAPPVVLGSCAQWDPDRGEIVGQLLTEDESMDVLRRLLEDETRIIVGAYLVFDLLCGAVHWARKGVDLIPLIWKAHRDGRIFDVLLGMALHDTAMGHLAKMPDGSDLRDPLSREPSKRYPLAIVHHLLTGDAGAKAAAKYRLSYGMFRGWPLDQLPYEARVYPVHDAVNTLRDALILTGHLPRQVDHLWTGDNQSTCSRCGTAMTDLGFAHDGSKCWQARRHRNLHAMADQCETSWAMYLGAAWGFPVDQDEVTRILDEVREVREKASVSLLAAGFLKRKKEKGVEKLSKDKAAIARAVAQAFEATGKCPDCREGKILSASAKPTRCRGCRGKGHVPCEPRAPGEISAGVATCPECRGAGKVTYGPLINCKKCCATGLDLSTAPMLTRTDPSDMYPEGQIQASRDVLNESGDEGLRALADYDEDAKTETTYVPYLRRARIDCVGPDGQVYYRDVPLTLRPNPFLETDRTSYSDPIQQFPRDGALRTCLRARLGRLLVSCDYNQGELVTHAESCLRIVGWSKLAEALLEGAEPHKKLGAAMLGVPFDEFCRRFDTKDKKCKDARQAAKPPNFGFPGGMGAPKLVMQSRKQGPDTPCPNGPVVLDEKKGTRGYRGMRFCVLMDGAPYCGQLADGTPNKVRAWGRPGFEREIPPTCKACIECAERLLALWFEQWPENRPYRRYATDCYKNGQEVTPDMLARWPHLAADCRVDATGKLRLAPGEVVQHESGIVRGGVGYNDACNGWFQSLLAVAAKLALRRAQRECTDETVLVPTDACEGGVASAYAGRVSPLRGNRVTVFQHDECIAEIWTENPKTGYTAHDAATRLSEIMVRALQETCRRMTKACKAPPAMADRWHKAMEPMYHLVNGRKTLVPWSPEHADPAKCDHCKAAA